MPVSAQEHDWHTEQNGIRHPWQYTEFTAEAGLTGSFVLDLAFDARGDLWIASAQGLGHFDGVRWNHYGVDDGLPSTFVRAVYADRQGRVWVGTDQGLAVGDADGFDASIAQPSARNIRRIRQAPDGSIWICSDSWLRADVPGGLNVIRDGEIRDLPAPDAYVSDVRFLRDGRTVLLTAVGAFVRLEDDWEPLGDSAEKGYPRDLTLTAEGDILLATDVDVYRLDGRRFVQASSGIGRPDFSGFIPLSDGSTVLIDREVGAIKRWTNSGWVDDGLLNGAPSIPEAMTEGPDGALWFVGMNHLGRFGPSAEWITHPQMSGAPFEDSAGRLWFSGERGTWVGGHDGWDRVDPDEFHIVSRQIGTAWLWNENSVARYDANDNLQTFRPQDIGLDRIDQFDAGRSGVAAAAGRRGAGFGIVQWDASGWLMLEPDLDVPGIAAVAVDDRTVWVAGTTPPTGKSLVFRIEDGTVSVTEAPAITSLTQLSFVTVESPPLIAGDFGVARLEGERWEIVDDLPARLVLGWYRTRERTWIAHSSSFGGPSGITMTGPSGSMLHRLAPLRPLATNVMYTDGSEIAVIDTTGRGAVLLIDSPAAEPEFGLHDARGDYWVYGDGNVFHLPFDSSVPETWLDTPAEQVFLGQDLVIAVYSRIPWRSRDAERRQFSYRLDAGPWSLFEWRPYLTLPTGNLETGLHTVEVRARTRFGIIDPTPARLSFVVAPTPIQERVWFWPVVASVFLFVLGTLVSALRSRLKIRRLNMALEDRVRKRTLALEETRTRLAAIVLASPAPIMVLDADTTVEVCNPAGADLLGMPTDAIIGRRLADFLDPVGGERLREMVDDVLGGRPIRDKLLSPTLPRGRQIHIAASAVTLSPALEDVGKVLWIGIEITDRVRAQKQLQAVSLELQRVQELERRRLAQDLHDDVGGSLTTLKMAFLTDLHADKPPDQAALKERVAMVQELMDRIRTVSLMLRPATLDDFGLSAAVATLVNRVRDVYPGTVTLEDQLDPDRRLQEDVQTAAYRIIQECLTNTARHSGASEISVRLWKENGSLRISVEDDGRGFDASMLDEPLDSSGLSGMRRRAEVLGGRLWIVSSDRGTRVEAELPLVHASPEVEDFQPVGEV